MLLTKTLCVNNNGMKMILRKILLVLTVFFISSAAAAEITINTSSSGSAIDNAADGVFDSFTSSLTSHAQKTNFLNIFTVTRGMLEFELSSLTLPVDNATFSFYVIGRSGPGTTVEILRYEGDGSVELSDAYLGSTIVASFDVPSTGSFNVDVTEHINNFIINGIPFVGFNMRMTSEYSPSSVGYDNEINVKSSYESAVFPGPVLVITEAPVAVSAPLPLSAWFFCSFIMSLIGLRNLRDKTNRVKE